MSDLALAYNVSEDKPHRGRPRDEEKNQAILDAAVSLFLEHGYDATSMDLVAKKAGVSKQTVYSHFEGKEGLFSSAIRCKIDEYRVQDALDLLDHHTLEDDLMAVGRSFARLLHSDEAMDMFRLLAAHAAKGPELAERFWAAGPAEMTLDLVNFLQSWIAAGELKIDDTEEAANQLFALLKGGLHFRRAIGLQPRVSEDQIEAHVQSCVHMFLTRYRTHVCSAG